MDYYRAYAALTEEQPGFSLPGKKSFGKAIIDARGASGKLLVSVQGMKPNELYKIYMVAKNIGAPSSRFSGVFMADLRVNEKGAGEAKLTFDASNVGGSGFMVGLFSVVAIIVHNAPVLTAPLVGYVSEPVFWKNGFEIFRKEDGEVEKKEVGVVETEATVDVAEEVKAAEFVEVIEAAETEAAEAAVEPATAEAATEPAETAETVLPTVALGNPAASHENYRDYVRDYIAESERDLGSLAEVKSERLETEAAAATQISPEATEKLNHMFRRNARMSPFINHSGDVVWIRISPEQAHLIGLSEIAASELALTAFRRYRHLVLGRTAGSQYILGIPGVYTEQTLAIAKPLGLSFNQCNGGGPVENSYGYWVVQVK